MDMDLAFVKPRNLSLAQAATIGVGVEVSFEEIFWPL
jgi:hypothetical protein